MPAAMFKNRAASLAFANLYETLDEVGQSKFGEAIRVAAKVKLLAETAEDYYLTEEDIYSIFKDVEKNLIRMGGDWNKSNEH